MDSINMTEWAVTIDSDNSDRLADFYAKLLGWEKIKASEEFLIVVDKAHPGLPWLTFQTVENYIPPVWPAKPGMQQTMTHLDFHVKDIEAAAAFARECGAIDAPVQTTDEWHVMLDPAGHPFCLCHSLTQFLSQL